MDSLLVSILKPFARFCLRHAVRMPQLQAAFKRAYIEVAKEDLQRARKPSTASALSAMTGLHRKDCSRLLQPTQKEEHPDDLLTRILGSWQGSARYTSEAGKPRVLTCHGSNSEFFELVRSESVDLNPYTVLNEFLRIGAIKRTPHGVKVASRVFVPRGDSDRILRMMAREIDLLMLAVDENVQDEEKVPNLHINTTYDNIPLAKLASIRKWVLEEGSAFHDRVRRFLAKQDRDTNPKVSDKEGRITVSIGSFSKITIFDKRKIR